jgi:glyoxylase-like metal-dependent hydrolase (beta-lactamase superfamily II)/rhodanese-related sulfurtransferase
MLATEVQVAVSAQPVEEVYTQLLQDRSRLILDVRNEEDFARWRVEGRQSLEVINIPYFDFIEDEAEAMARVPITAREVLVVCAKEGSAEFVAEILKSHGIQASYLAGGIMNWGGYYDIREVVNSSFGRIVQVARPARGDLSFVVISDGQAAVIDPLRHTEHYQWVVDESGARITHIFDTHAHADHISGGPALSQQTGAAYYLHAYDAIHPMDMLPAHIDYQHLTDGQRFKVGQFTVKVIWFPGHTLGQVNYLFTDPDGQSYLFSGDGIFLNSFGRPDLGGQGEAWAPILYDSLFKRLPPHLNDDTLILPAHFSTLDEDDGHGRFAKPYGQVREQNEALKSRSKAEFLDYVLSHLPVFPPEYIQIKRVNIGLVEPTEEEATELELGKNICALSE